MHTPNVPVYKKEAGATGAESEVCGTGKSTFILFFKGSIKNMRDFVDISVYHIHLCKILLQSS